MTVSPYEVGVFRRVCQQEKYTCLHCRELDRVFLRKPIAALVRDGVFIECHHCQGVLCDIEEHEANLILDFATNERDIRELRNSVTNILTDAQVEEIQTALVVLDYLVIHSENEMW